MHITTIQLLTNTSKSKEIDDFLNKFSSKNIISANSVIDNNCIS